MGILEFLKTFTQQVSFCIGFSFSVQSRLKILNVIGWVD